jgi:hypothetical protein
MNTKLPWLFTVLLLACLHPAEAQQAKKVYRMGYLSAVDPGRESARSEAPFGWLCASLVT